MPGGYPLLSSVEYESVGYLSHPHDRCSASSALECTVHRMQCEQRTQREQPSSRHQLHSSKQFFEDSAGAVPSGLPTSFSDDVVERAGGFPPAEIRPDGAAEVSVCISFLAEGQPHSSTDLCGGLLRGTSFVRVEVARAQLNIASIHGMIVEEQSHTTFVCASVDRDPSNSLSPSPRPVLSGLGVASDEVRDAGHSGRRPDDEVIHNTYLARSHCLFYSSCINIDGYSF